MLTWYEGDLVAKACRTYCVTPAGTCRGMSSASYGLAQGLQCATVTRGLAAGPERFEGRSRYSNLSLSGRPSGVLAAEEGPTAIILKGPVQFSESFSLKTLLSAPFRKPWWIPYDRSKTVREGAREVSDVDFIGGKARGGANGVVIGVFWCSLQTMANTCAIVWYP